jgi:hypothetical protein
MTRLCTRALLAGAVLVLPVLASAHHSIQAQFDIYKTITVKGTVARMEFINPHSYLTVNVTGADGKVTKWAFEMTGLAGLRRAGLSRADRGGTQRGQAQKTGKDVTAHSILRRLRQEVSMTGILCVAQGRRKDPSGGSHHAAHRNSAGQESPGPET